jgi:hypothetical protein
VASTPESHMSMADVMGTTSKISFALLFFSSIGQLVFLIEKVDRGKISILNLEYVSLSEFDYTSELVKYV